MGATSTQLLIQLLQSLIIQKNTVIGVLDIYGFEVFDNNSFEQFCINYCNERLQQLFIELVLKQQQEEYESEGLEWVHIDYFNNQIICDLVDLPHKGVLALMDEACLNVGKTTDSMLLEAMDKKLKGNEHYTSRSIDSKENKNLVIGQDFVIRHYAGNVVYNVYGFIEKNRDTLFQDFKRLLYSSKNPIYKSMWPEGSHDITKTTKRPLTAGTIFKNSMNELMKILASKEPFYVRCIKPNERKSPVTIDRERVIHQISYLGLLENVRVRRAGFAFRQDYTRFLLRYKMLAKPTWPNYRGSEVDGVKAILKAQKLDKDVTYGYTKLFVQSPESLFQLEESREKELPRLVTFLQKIWRGVRARRLFKKMKAALKIGLWYRHCVTKQYVKSICSSHQNVKRLPDYGKNIRWPTDVRHRFKRADNMIQNIFQRWRAFMILSKYPQEAWPEMHLKITALELLRGKRAQWGIHRRWKGDYLNDTAENTFYDAYRSALMKDGINQKSVLFSAPVKKFNRHGKVTERALILTKDNLIKMETGKKFKVALTIPLVDVMKLSLSPDAGNQVIIIQLRGNNNDLVLSLNSSKNEDLCGELVGILSSIYCKKMGRNLEVFASNRLTARSGKAEKIISISSGASGANSTFVKNKDGTVTYS